MQGAGCYYILCKNTCVCEVNKLERRFYLVDAQVLPEVFLKVVRAKELLASGEARSISAATRSVDLSRSAFYKYKDCIFDSENSREVNRVLNEYVSPTPFEPGFCTRGLYLRGVE